VVSWNEAAEMNDSVESDALVMPRQQGHAVGGLAAAVHDLFVLFHEAEAIDLLVHEEVVSPTRVTRTERSI
jgi:hypothetical protein